MCEHHISIGRAQGNLKFHGKPHVPPRTKLIVVPRVAHEQVIRRVIVPQHFGVSLLCAHYDWAQALLSRPLLFQDRTRNSSLSVASTCCCARPRLKHQKHDLAGKAFECCRRWYAARLLHGSHCLYFLSLCREQRLVLCLSSARSLSGALAKTGTALPALYVRIRYQSACPAPHCPTLSRRDP